MPSKCDSLSITHRTWKLISLWASTTGWGGQELRWNRLWRFLRSGTGSDDGKFDDMPWTRSPQNGPNMDENTLVRASVRCREVSVKCHAYLLYVHRWIRVWGADWGSFCLLAASWSVLRLRREANRDSQGTLRWDVVVKHRFKGEISCFLHIKLQMLQ